MTDILHFYAVFLALGVLLTLLLRKHLRLSVADMRVLIIALHIRILFTFGYYRLFLHSPADAHGYFRYAQRGVVTNLARAGTQFVRNLSALLYPFSSLFDNEYLMHYIPFSLCGFAGSVLFYAVIKKIYKPLGKKYRRELLLITVAMPNVIFWTSNIGKDSIVYLGLCTLLYGTTLYPNLVKTVVVSSVGALITYYIRPHVMMFYTLSLFMGIFLQKRGLSGQNIALSLVVLVVFSLTYEQVFRYVGIDVSQHMDESVASQEGEEGPSLYEESLANIERRAAALDGGGSGTGRRTVNPLFFPLYALQFLLGPFLWQTRTPIQITAAVENIIYQLMIIFIIRNRSIFLKTQEVPFKYGILTYVLLMSVIMGATFTNLGLIVRQKVMILPFLIYLYAKVRAQSVMTKGNGK